MLTARDRFVKRLPNVTFAITRYTSASVPTSTSEHRLSPRARRPMIVPRKESGHDGFNVVRFHVKPGHDEAFLEAHRRSNPDFLGFRHGSIIKTGQHRYCLIAHPRRHACAVPSAQ